MQVSNALRDVLARLPGYRTCGKGYSARCPAHEDRHPSLSIGQGQGGKVLLHCFAGCSPEEIVRALGLQMHDLFEKRQDGSVIVATYDYEDEEGNLLYQCVRYHPKSFCQRRPNGHGGWIWNLNDTRRVLFHLPQLNQAALEEIVFLCEGEADVLRLEALGFIATTSPMGASNWRVEYCEMLQGRRIIILPDNDEQGKRYASVAHDTLRMMVKSVHIVELPDLPAGGDVSDWLRMGGTTEQLLELAKEAQKINVEEKIFPDPIPASKLRNIDPLTQWIWKGYLARGTTTLLSALWKAGKTTFLSHLLRSFETGGTFCGYDVRPSRVLYVTEEPESRWAERRDELGLKDHLEFLIRPFKGKPRMDKWERFLEYTATIQQANAYDLVIFDTLSNLWPVKDENDAAAVQSALMPLYNLVEQCALMVVHHARKTDGQEATAARGSGALPAFVDTIMELRRFNPSDRKDRRRKISGYGRYNETPEEVVVELTDEGFVSLGDADTLTKKDITAIITYVLPTSPPGMTADEILEEWPALIKPGRNNFLAALREGSEHGTWKRTGGGKRSDPFRFYRDVGDGAVYGDSDEIL